MPHFGHVTPLLEMMAGVLVLAGVVIGARAISSRSGIGRRDTYWPVVVEVHTCDDIDPEERANISILLALDFNQGDRQSCCLNDVACQNM